MRCPVAVVLGLLVAGCGGGSGTAPAPMATGPTPTSVASIGPGEGALTVLSVPGYVEAGATDPKINWVREFEKRTQCRVTLRTSPTPDKMDELFAKGRYDVVSASPRFAGALIAARKVAPVNSALVLGFGDLTTRLREVAGPYGVPFLWAANVKIYDPERLRSARIFSRTDPVLLRDNPLTIADAALHLKTAEPELGIKDPFRLTAAQFDAAVELLVAQENARYWKDPSEVVEALAGGGIPQALAWPYQAGVLNSAGRRVNVAEGEVTGFVDTWMISAAAEHPSCAYQWLSWMSSPRVQADAARWTGLGPANPGACRPVPLSTATALPEEPADASPTPTSGSPTPTLAAPPQATPVPYGPRFCEAYPDSLLRRVVFAELPRRDCGAAKGECTDYAEWTRRWREITK